MLISKIISAGQSRVEREVISAANDLGFPCGGVISKGHDTGGHAHLECIDKLTSVNYESCVELNALNSDVTVIIHPFNWEFETEDILPALQQFCSTHCKPCLVVNELEIDGICELLIDAAALLVKCNLVVNFVGIDKIANVTVKENIYAFVRRLILEQIKDNRDVIFGELNSSNERNKILNCYCERFRYDPISVTPWWIPNFANEIQAVKERIISGRPFTREDELAAVDYDIYSEQPKDGHYSMDEWRKSIKIQGYGYVEAIDFPILELRIGLDNAELAILAYCDAFNTHNIPYGAWDETEVVRRQVSKGIPFKTDDQTMCNLCSRMHLLPSKDGMYAYGSCQTCIQCPDDTGYLAGFRTKPTIIDAKLASKFKFLNPPYYAKKNMSKDILERINRERLVTSNMYEEYKKVRFSMSIEELKTTLKRLLNYSALFNAKLHS